MPALCRNPWPVCAVTQKPFRRHSSSHSSSASSKISACAGLPKASSRSARVRLVQCVGSRPGSRMRGAVAGAACDSSLQSSSISVANSISAPSSSGICSLASKSSRRRTAAGPRGAIPLRPSSCEKSRETSPEPIRSCNAPKLPVSRSSIQSAATPFRGHPRSIGPISTFGSVGMLGLLPALHASPVPFLVVPEPGPLQGRKMFAAPIAKRLEEGVKAPVERCHGLLDAGRDLFVMHTLDDAVTLEVAKLLGEHSLRDLRNPPLQLHEPQRTLHHQGVDNGRLPLSGDDPHDRLHALDRALVVHGQILYSVPKMCLVDFEYRGNQ